MDRPRPELDTRPATRQLKDLAALTALIYFLFPPAAHAQQRGEPGRPLAAVIDDYVREGLASNLSLRAQSLEVERAAAALDEARARYFPEAGFAARYSRSEGGRTIELPLGDALNPAYQTLNEMLIAQGQAPRFPVVQNETIAFLRETEQDTRITLRMPIIAPAIPAAVRAQRELLGASEYSRQALARRLKRDITVGYLRWLGSVRNQGIVDASVLLLDENLRVNESLFRNGKVTQDLVLRARAEQLQVMQQSRDARNLAAQAQSYLNFLLNRPLDTPLENAEVETNISATTRALAELRQAAIDNRPELAELAHLTRASEANTSIARAERWPTLSLGADGGIQGEEYEFGRGSNYATVSLLLNWTFFDGGARRAAVRQADAVARRTQTQYDELTQQVQLEVQQSLDQLNTSADSLATAAARSDAARAAFRIASRKRDEGAISQVEFIDARSSLTGAELNLNVTRFEVLARQAELDYATAAGNLPLGPIHERN
jgi:outer membrane protein TolC